MRSINKKDDKIFDERAKLTFKCSCGHSMFMPVFLEKKLCSYCGNYFYNPNYKPKVDKK